MLVIFIILLVISILLGLVGEVYKGYYSGNSDMVRSSAQFWFLIFGVATAIVGFIHFS